MYVTKSHSQIERDETADIVYYNIIMTCPTAQSNTLASYEETRTQAIIDNPSDYYMSIIRFSIDGSNIPIFVCPVIINPMNANDVNFTPFQVTLQYAGANYTENLIFVPESDAVAPLPPTATRDQDFTSYYYYVYYYSTLVNMINNALAAAYARVVVANPGLIAQAPYFIYDRDQQKFGLVVQNIDNNLVPGTNIYLTQFNTDGTPKYNASQVSGTINIFLNSRIYPYFDGIEAFYLNNDLVKTNLIIVRDTEDDYYYPPQNAANLPANQVIVNFTNANNIYTAQPAYFIIRQQYNTIS